MFQMNFTKVESAVTLMNKVGQMVAVTDKNSNVPHFITVEMVVAHPYLDQFNVMSEKSKEYPEEDFDFFLLTLDEK